MSENESKPDMKAIESVEAIEAYRLRLILRGLKLQVDTGLKHSHNAPAQAARVILHNAGKSEPRNISKLHDAFRSHLQSIGVVSTPSTSSPEKGGPDGVR